MSAGWRSVRPMRRRSEHKVVGRDVRGRIMDIKLYEVHTSINNRTLSANSWWPKGNVRNQLFNIMML